VVGRNEHGRGRHGHLVLLRTIFGEEGIRLGLRRADRRHQHLAEHALTPEGAQAVGMAWHVLHAGIDELLLKGGAQIEAACLRQSGGRPAQEFAHAAGPRGAIDFAYVAEEEVLRSRAIPEVHMHFRRGVRHDHQVARGAEGRVQDRTETGLHQVGVGPANAHLAALGQLGGRKSLAPDKPRDIAGSDKNQFFAQHCGPKDGTVHLKG